MTSDQLEIREPVERGYPHLAYLRARIGYEVKRDMPRLTGPEVEALYARGSRWPGGGPPD